MGLGGFFKAIWRGIRKVLPFLGDALDNEFIRLILISKLGENIVNIIRELVKAVDKVADLDNNAKHEYVRSAFLNDHPETVSNSDLDVHIKMAVKELRGEGSIQVPKVA